MWTVQAFHRIYRFENEFFIIFLVRYGQDKATFCYYLYETERDKKILQIHKKKLVNGQMILDNLTDNTHEQSNQENIQDIVKNDIILSALSEEFKDSMYLKKI